MLEVDRANERGRTRLKPSCGRVRPRDLAVMRRTVDGARSRWSWAADLPLVTVREIRQMP